MPHHVQSVLLHCVEFELRKSYWMVNKYMQQLLFIVYYIKDIYESEICRWWF